MKKILVICGHPDSNSLNAAFAEHYSNEARQKFEVRTLNLRDLNFNYNLEYGYNKRTELEPDLLAAQQDIMWADHLVWFFPTWWGSYPAVMKAFLDRTMLPGFAFKYRENS
ncbi:MAG: NAD(P)H-dependent oxidoreductase, partial [Marinoscillum sp.]